MSNRQKEKMEDWQHRKQVIDHFSSSVPEGGGAKAGLGPGKGGQDPGSNKREAARPERK